MNRLLPVCILAALALSACTGAQKVDDTPERPALMDAGALVTKYARWLPADAVGVGVIDVDATIRYVAGEPVPMDDPEREAKLAAREDALRADLSKLSRERLGMDLTGASTIIVGGGPIMQSMIVLGVTPAAEDAVEVEGMKAFKVVPRHPADAEAMGDGAPEKWLPWALALPGGEGVVLFAGKQRLETLAGSDGMSLAKAEVLGEYADALSRLPSRVAFVMGTGALAPLLGEFEDEVGFKAPRIVSMTFGDHVGVLLRGDPASLEAIEDIRREQQDTVIGELEPRYQARAEQATPLALAVTLGYHLALGSEEVLDVRLDGDALSYSMPARFLAPSASAGVLAAIAIPAFLRSVKKSKTAEADGMMRKLTDGARVLYTNDCTRPPVLASTSEVPRDGGKEIPIQGDDAARDALGVAFVDPLYFSYDAYYDADDPNRYVVRARADFKTGGPMHTVTQYIDLIPADADGACEAYVGPPFTMNEFE